MSTVTIFLFITTIYDNMKNDKAESNIIFNVSSK